MKLRLSFSFRIKKPSDVFPLVRSLSIAVLVLYSAWIAWTLYQTVILDVIAPRPIDPSQVTAKQEKVNAKLLNTVTTRDAARRKSPDFSTINDPFSP